MTIAEEFEQLHKTYAALVEELGKAFETSNGGQSDAAASVLRNRECLSRIEQMHEKVRQVSAAWQKLRAHLDPQCQNQAEHFIEAAKADVLRLKQICGVHTQKLIALQTRILSDIGNIGKGARLLHSLKPIKNNYPKFIDSSV